MNYLVIITGPTGVGKTELSIALAQYFNADILSADSRQIYQGLKIGTAAPSTEDLQKVKHYFIATQNINNYYSVSQYEIEAIAILDKIYQNKNINKTCKKAIEDFIESNPLLHNFAKKHLKLEQLYRVEFKNGECILYDKSQRSFSEVLLLNGLAIRKPFFKDYEYRYHFKRAQDYAKELKKGFWKNKMVKTCIAELYKE